ncbi:MAG: hypothetical protein OXK75_00070 [Gammaproteobacteria bacterium]|nr:hypothetical protein [Gammaproteobacteria bacterium]
MAVALFTADIDFVHFHFATKLVVTAGNNTHRLPNSVHEIPHGRLRTLISLRILMLETPLMFVHMR